MLLGSVSHGETAPQGKQGDSRMLGSRDAVNTDIFSVVRKETGTLFSHMVGMGEEGQAGTKKCIGALLDLGFHKHPMAESISGHP